MEAQNIGLPSSQAKCAVGMSKSAVKVSKARLATTGACMKTAAASFPTTVSTATCNTDDSKGKVAGALTKLGAFDTAKCVPDPPTYGYTNAATVGGAAVAEMNGAVGDLLGAGPTVNTAADVSCLVGVNKTFAKAMDAKLKTFVGCKKGVKKPAPKVLDALDLSHCIGADPKGKIQKAIDKMSANKGALAAGALTTAATVGEVLAGIFLALLTLFFFLRDGAQIWEFLCRLLPRPARIPATRAGRYSWVTLVSYVRATVLVAFVDAVGIGIGLAILRVPLALPLAALVFLTAFIPVIGATLSGAVAVLVALVTQGPITALIVLAIVIAVQQLEGHVLQPLIMGRAVAIHPLAVILAIAAGVVLAGIIGALVAVPIVAVLNTGIRHLAMLRRAEETGAPPPGPPEPTGPPMPGEAGLASLSSLPPGP